MKMEWAAALIVLLGLMISLPSMAESGKKLIALTFDDGPNTTTTTQVLDVLRENEVPSTFFLIGQNINAQSAQSVKKAMSLGCEIACLVHIHLPHLDLPRLLLGNLIGI